MTDTATEPDARHTTPRSAGIRRPVKNIKPGWWIHMEAAPGFEGVGDCWERVSWIADSASWRRIVFDHVLDPDDEHDGNMVRAHKDDTAVTLTEREAKRFGLAEALAASKAVTS